MTELEQSDFFGFRSPVTPGHPHWPMARAEAEKLLGNLVAFEASELCLEVRCRFLGRTTLWLVPRQFHVDRLLADGVAAGRIWTALELMQLFTATDRRDRIHFVVRTKLFFDGELTGNPVA